MNEMNEMNEVNEMNEMNEMNKVQDDEIDLFELFQTLWDGKWKIIATTFAAAVIGIVFSIVKPNSFEVSTPIGIGKQSLFLQYALLNDLLKNEGMLYDVEKNPNGYIFDSVSIFKMFTIEINDNEEMVDALRTSEFVQKSIKDLKGEDKQKALIKFANAFELKAPPKNKNNWTLSFEWHDALEGKRLFADAIRQSLLNTKNISIANVNNWADAIDARNEQSLGVLHNELSLIKKNQIERNRKRIQYLVEQSAIAKELGIATNRLDANALSQSSQNAISLSVNSNDIPYYLRGYKAIDKEVTQIENRSDEQNLLNADRYIDITEEISSLEADLSSSQLRKALVALAKDNPNDWVEFNLAVADVKSTKKPMLYVALFIVLGGIVGLMYVLVSSALRKRNASSAKA